MTNLNSAQIGMNKFCGPAVLSILTGKSTDECAKVISSVNGAYKVEGVHLSHLMRAADKLGFDNQIIPPSGTLYMTLVRLSRMDGMYIVTVPNHFVAIEVREGKAYFCDNHTKDPIPAASSARLLQQVLNVNKVIKRPETVIEKPVTIELTQASPQTNNTTPFVPPQLPSPQPDEIRISIVYNGRNVIVAKFRFSVDAERYCRNLIGLGYIYKPFNDKRSNWEVK